MKRLLTIAALVTVVAITGAGTANAQATGTTDIDIDFPNLLVLYYYDAIDVNINAEDVVDLLGATAANANADEAAVEETGSAITASAGGTDLEATLNVAGTLNGLGTLTDVQLDLLGVWGVRGLSGPANIQVNPTANTSLVNAGSTIGVSTPRIRVSGGGTWTDAGSNIPSFSTTGLGTLQRGDIQLTLDLSGVTLSGSHSSGSDGTYTITAARP